MKKKALNLALCLLAGFSLSAQTTLDVTSDKDAGAGSLRHLVENAEANTVINIPADYTITLESPIVIAKNLTINGQGATIKTIEPGVSEYRLFELGSSSGGSVLNISFENVKLQGGNLVAQEQHGGAILIIKRVNLGMKNCEITDSKAKRGGAIHVNDGVGVSALIEDCTFKGNNASEYAGACSFSASQNQTDGPGEAVFKNTTFEANTSEGASAVNIDMPATFENCLFQENISSGTSRGSCVFRVNAGIPGDLRLNGCTFVGNSTAATNPASNQDGGTFVAVKGENNNIYMTNCTFYDNRGGRGAIYVFQGKVFMINCTVSGNIAYNNKNSYGGGIYTTTDGNNVRRELMLLNTIVAYNYSYHQAADATEPSMELADTYFGAKPIVTATKNIIASNKKANEALVTIESPVAFFYDDVDATLDDPLFAEYTTNAEGNKVPAYDPETRTIALAEDGVATGTGLGRDMVIDPELEALIPLTDQRGVTRSTSEPSLGAYEFEKTESAVKFVSDSRVSFIASNPAIGTLQLNNNAAINRLDIVDLTGKVVFTAIQPDASVELNGIAAGHYIVRIEGIAGRSAEKLIIK